MRNKTGRITAAGETIDVAFEPVYGAIDEGIADAYRAKYGSSSYLAPMVGARARATTVRVMPAE